MEVILILRQLTDAEKSDVQLAEAKGTAVFVMPGLLTGPDAKYIPETLIKEAAADLISTIKELGDKETGHTSLSRLLTIEGVPLWHYQRFRVFFLLRSDWIINRCIAYYRKEYPKLKIYTPSGFTLNEQANTEQGDDSLDVNQSRTVNKSPFNIRVLFNYVLFFKLRVLISMFRRVNISDKSNVIVDRSIRQVCRNLNTLEKKIDNFNLYPLFDSNTAGQLIISEVETPKLHSVKPFKLWKHYFNGEGRKDRTVYGEWILFKGLLSSAVRGKYKSLKSQFEQVSNEVISLPQTMLTKEESKILKTFFSLKKSSHFYLLKHLCYYNFFRKYKFKTICAIDENSPATRSILDAARKCAVKTIGIQHGNIGDSQPAYLYSSKDAANKVMTDLTLTWGDYFTGFLLSKANYPPGSVKTVGQMRSDLIPAMKARSAEYRKSITDSPFLVVFASQPIPDADFRHKVAYDVFKSFSKIRDAKLIVKLHPAERFDADYYNSISLEAGCENADIRYEIDLYELLAAADLVITCFSTVGSEAVYFGKPLIIYDPFNEDLLKYVSEGVAFQATGLQSLQTLVEKIRTGQLAIDDEKYSGFIRKYAFAIDGQATYRTLENL
ncbi:MAG TPA: hypothetical protein VK172_12165 [Lentimicrobium sp.]|nr:hypothetical protein [Lentimicrobium sp.]